MELKDTIDGMISDDYKERFKAEYMQLTIRYNKLIDIIDKYDNNILEFELTCGIRMLKEQARRMSNYAEILRERARAEGINLD